MAMRSTSATCARAGTAITVRFEHASSSPSRSARSACKEALSKSSAEIRPAASAGIYVSITATGSSFTLRRRTKRRASPPCQPRGGVDSGPVSYSSTRVLTASPVPSSCVPKPFIVCTTRWKRDTGFTNDPRPRCFDIKPSCISVPSAWRTTDRETPKRSTNSCSVGSGPVNTPWAISARRSFETRACRGNGGSFFSNGGSLTVWTLCDSSSPSCMHRHPVRYLWKQVRSSHPDVSDEHRTRKMRDHVQP